MKLRYNLNHGCLLFALVLFLSAGSAVQTEAEVLTPAGEVLDLASVGPLEPVVSGEDLLPFKDVAISGDGTIVMTWGIQSRALGETYFAYPVYARRFTREGLPLTDVIEVNAASVSLYRNEYACVASDGNGNFVVCWVQRQTGDSKSYPLFACLYNADGKPRGGSFRIDSGELGVDAYKSYPAVAMNEDGRFVVAWVSRGAAGEPDPLLVKRFDANGMALDETPLVVSNDERRISPIETPSVAINSAGDFVVAWCNEIPITYTVFFRWTIQKYKSDGRRDGLPKIVGKRFNSLAEMPKILNKYKGSPSSPVVGINPEGFVGVGWVPCEDGPSWDPCEFAGPAYRLYGASGIARGSEFPVSETLGLVNLNQHLEGAMDDDGMLILSWKGTMDGCDGAGIYLAGIVSQDNGESDILLVEGCDENSGNLSFPAMDANGRGDTAVTWVDEVEDTLLFKGRLYIKK